MRSLTIDELQRASLTAAIAIPHPQDMSDIYTYQHSRQAVQPHSTLHFEKPPSLITMISQTNRSSSPIFEAMSDTESMESSSPPTPTLHSSPNRLRAQVHKLHDELSHSHQTHSKLYADLSEKEAEIRRLKQEAKHWKSQCTQLRHYAEEQDQHYSSTSTRQKEDAESVVVKLRMESRQYQAEVCRLEGELSLSQQELEGVNQMYHTLKQEYESANCEWRTEMEELKEALQETSLGHAALIESSDVQQRMLQEQIVQLEHQLGQMKQENESFLNLLHVKTLSGEMDLSGHTRRCSGNDELLSPATSGTTLADELMSVNSASEQGRTEMEYRLRVLEEDNRALLLYINRILSRIMESDDERIKHVLNNSNAREML